MKSLSEPIYVTKPYLPPLEEITPYLEDIWERKVVTNNGPYHQKLESQLCDYLGVEYLSLFANGTLALITALQALNITGEVITTPFSFVATAHSLWWNNIEPKFADLENKTYNLSADHIESLITPKTTAILPVHVFGNPCDVDRIQYISDTYGLKIIYDAAHAFGVKVDSKSLLSYGDLSIVSFHATKVFNTFEGGAIICHDAKMKERIDYLKNFGFADEVTVTMPGINAKMNEFQSALGLVQLKHIDDQISKRKDIDKFYRSLLISIRGITLFPQNPKATQNYSYFPILVKKEYGRTRDFLYEYLKSKNIYCRRYFYPLITSFPMYSQTAETNVSSLPTAHSVSEEIICLPIYPDLSHEIVEMICHYIKDCRNKQ